ncbi:hypothetical protein HKX48_001442 [Thoreauomyces humboldtii]|nr:hypothetical protein HKX48_001442 [Thoreauomyces humboldtii]
MHAKIALLSAVSFLTSSVVAWGFEGHSAVGYVADHWIKNETKTARDYLLPTGWNFNRSATWADEIKTGPQAASYAWSFALHYIDAADVTPLDTNSTTPLDCEVKFPRDSFGGINIVDAIRNYTTRLETGKYNLSWEQRSEAVRFLTHFLGDVTQPLHTCGKLVGGNTFFVNWENSTTYTYNGKPAPYQLHYIWDFSMPEKDIKGAKRESLVFREIGKTDFAGLASWADNFNNSLDLWHQWLLNSTLPGGVWHDEAPSWYDATTPLNWAQDANDLNCGKVWDKTLLSGNGTYSANDLSGAYYQQNYMQIRKQLAKGGYRLAKYMDLVLANQPLSDNVTDSSSSSPNATSSTGSPSATSSLTPSAKSAAFHLGSGVAASAAVLAGVVAFLV